MQSVGSAAPPERHALSVEEGLGIKKDGYRTLKDCASAASERDFALGCDAIQVEVGTAMDKFLCNVLEHDENLVDPVTHRRYDCTVQALERRVAHARDLMAQEQALFFAYMDRIEAFDAEAGGWSPGPPSERKMQLQKMNRPDLVRNAKDAFHKSEVLHRAAAGWAASYGALAASRRDRLAAALELARHSNPTDWVPSEKTMAAVAEEHRAMQFGAKPSDYFRIQHCLAEQTGRLLFSPFQVSRTGQHLGEDVFHKGPVSGDVASLCSMLRIYVDGRAQRERERELSARERLLLAAA